MAASRTGPANGRRKLIVVSNRGPIGYGRDDDGERIARRGGGGLVTALAPLVSHHDVTWIASAISSEDREVARTGPQEETAADGCRYRLRLVAHPPASYDLFYNVVANPVLWFLQHGLWEHLRRPNDDLGRAWDEGYVAVNRRFADAVVEELEREPEAAVFFHDYHLYLAPRFVRESRPVVALAHFTHIPWVGVENWSVLPPAIVQAIHDGLLANDVVGFQTERWRNAFLSVCAELDLDPGAALVTAHPISIDPDDFADLAASDAVLEQEQELLSFRPETLIVRVDRTDPSKNVVRGLEAFALLLERRPDLLGRVGMLALLDPSRQEIREYVDELERIKAACGGGRGAFARRAGAGDRGRLPPLDRRLQAVRRPARELGHGRAQPRREGGAAREHARRRCCLIGKHRRVRGDRRVDDSRRSVRRRADGDGTRAGARAARPPSAGRESMRSARHVRAHDLRAWIDAQLADLDRATTMLRR